MIYIVLIIGGVFVTYFIAFAWVSIGFYKNAKKIPSEEKEQRKISVLIPARNEEVYITTCLTSLINQDYNPENFEIIVVNDHSTDNTEQLVNELVLKTNISITVLNLSKTYSKKEALKFGVEKSKYPIIATTDADCILPKTWLRKISNNIEGETSMLLGPVMFFKDVGFLNAFQLLDFSAIQGLTYGGAYYKHTILNNSANLAYLKKDLELVNGYDNYDTPSGDDVFLLEKFNKQKLSISSLLDKNFIVNTVSEKSWESFFNQRIRWASKSKFYTNKILLFFSGLILITNILVLLSYFLLLFDEELRVITIILLLSKWLIDFILLFLVTAFFEKRGVLIYFIPVQLVYPIYVVLIGLASRVYHFEWKGRKNK